MRKSIFVLLSLSFILTGCSSYYSIRYYNSQIEYQNKFNDFAGGKTLKIIMNNDSTINDAEGVVINNDSLNYTVSEENTKNTHMKISSKDIEKIDYLSSDYKSANIVLKDGRKVSAKDLKAMKNDSLSFIDVTPEILKTSISLKDVKEVTYTNRWLGVPGGLLFGFFTGFGVGLLGTFPTYDGGMTKTYDRFGSTLEGTALGIVIGPVAGWIVGAKKTYKFNPTDR